MNTVQDAYQPPVGGVIKNKFWFRLALLSIVLAITLGATVITGMRIAQDAQVREMNSNRRPPILNPNPIPDGTGAQE